MPTMSRRSAEVVRYFDDYAETYAERYTDDSLGGYGFRARRDVVLGLLQGRSGRILDIGCGPGVMTARLTADGFGYFGADASTRMVEVAASRFPPASGARFLAATATDLPFASGSFDVVICVGVVDRVENLHMAFAEMQRALRPGGVAVVTFPNPWSPAERWRKFVYNPVVDRLKGSYQRLRGRGRPRPLGAFETMRSVRVCRDALGAHFPNVSRPHYFNINPVLSPFDQLFPKTTVRLARRLERASGPVRRLGTGFALMATTNR
jgi:SAM-dependent methyltransferase